MSIKCMTENKKRLLEAAFFCVVAAFSFYTVTKGQNLGEICKAIRQLSFSELLAAAAAAIFFVSTEGCIIFYLLRSLDGKSGLLRCISYSFIGFFYSAITPSATGGQPMQLYYMKKDGNRLTNSSVVLMVVALLYKVVLVLCGIFMLLFWNRQLRFYLQGYYGLYLLGLALNVIVVMFLLYVMLVPEKMKHILLTIKSLLEKVKIWKSSEKQSEKVLAFVDSYQEAVQYLTAHKKKVCVAAGLTFLQRCSLFFLPCFIYAGFGLQGMRMSSIVFLQAAVYIAVDMLPIPGAQGITEMMYRCVFSAVFPDTYLMPSLYVTRGISFYFLLLISIGVVIGNFFIENYSGRFS